MPHPTLNSLRGCLRPPSTATQGSPQRQMANAPVVQLLAVLLCCDVYLVAKSCLTLSNPVNYSSPGSSVHGILQARILEWVAMPSSRGASQPRDRTLVFHTAGRFRTIWASRDAWHTPIYSWQWGKKLKVCKEKGSVGRTVFGGEGTLCHVAEAVNCDKQCDQWGMWAPQAVCPESSLLPRERVWGKK